MHITSILIEKTQQIYEDSPKTIKYIGIEFHFVIPDIITIQYLVFRSKIECKKGSKDI